MITLRPAKERGYANYGWLESNHTFSFANYYDPEHMGFRNLRVINEDRVAPGGGFDTHGHRDMEIITYILEGALEHKDSIGNGSIIKPGEIQKMSAGTGILHSEYNASQSDRVHLLQIWITPNQRGIAPNYQQQKIDLDQASGKFKLIAAPAGKNSDVTLTSDAEIYVSMLKPGDKVDYEIKPGRHGWLQVTRGAIKLNDLTLNTGDGAAISDIDKISLTAVENAEILLFDLS